MRLPELLERVEQRIGKRLLVGYQRSQHWVSAMRILGQGPGSGHERDYTDADVERVVAWLRMRDLGGEVSSDTVAVAMRRMALDLIPDEPERGSIVLSRGLATWRFPTTEDVAAGMMAIWVYD